MCVKPAAEQCSSGWGARKHVFPVGMGAFCWFIIDIVVVVVVVVLLLLLFSNPWRGTVFPSRVTML